MAGMLFLIDKGLLWVSGLDVLVWRRSALFFWEGLNAVAIDEHCYDLSGWLWRGWA